MTSWSTFAAEAPELESLVRESFDAGRHKTMATLRADGSPRISGIEVLVVHGELWIGSMPRSRKAEDLRRDGRVALHSASPDPAPDDHTDWAGDAKVAGRAVEVTDEGTRAQYLRALAELMPDAAPAPEQAESTFEFDLFRVEVHQAVATRVGDGGDHLVITTWHPGRGLRSIRRR